MIFKNKEDFETCFKFYTGYRFKNLTVDCFSSFSNFKDWIFQNAKMTEFIEDDYTTRHYFDDLEIFRNELYNILVFEITLRTAVERLQKDSLKTSSDFNISDNFARVKEIFIANDENGNTKPGYSTEKLYNPVDLKFVIQDCKKIFKTIETLKDLEREGSLINRIVIDSVIDMEVGEKILQFTENYTK